MKTHRVMQEGYDPRFPKPRKVFEGTLEECERFARFENMGSDCYTYYVEKI